MNAVRVVLVDDHAVVRSGYRRLLELEDGLRVVAEFSDGESAYAWLAHERADVVVLDLSMPGRGGLDTLARLKQRDSGLRVLVFSMHDSAAMVAQALRAGADGYLTKSSAPALLVQALWRVSRGERVLSEDVSVHATAGPDEPGSPLDALTPREFDVFRRIVDGAGLEEIARTLCLSYKTVANYQTIIRQKLDVDTPLEMMRLAQRLGVLER